MDTVELGRLAQEGGLALIVASFLFGLRHGIDVDHIAAITDISGSQDRPRTSLFLATVYALGHALVVLALGSLAVLAGERIPAGLDAVLGKVVGGTLILLAGYLLYSLIRYGKDYRLRSRWMMLLDATRALRARMRGSQEIVEFEHEHDHVHDAAHSHHHEERDRGSMVAAAAPVSVAARHRHVHRHVAPLPSDPFAGYGTTSALVIGMLHGVGAETPTQVLLFLTAAGVGGTTAGLTVLVSFIAGLFTSNTAVALVSAFGFGSSRKAPGLYVALGVLTAAFSLYLGVSFLV